MKTMFMFFTLGLLSGINSNEMILMMEAHPIMFRSIGIMLLIYLAIDFLQTILKTIKRIKKYRFNKTMMDKFSQCKMENVKEI